MQSRIRNQTRFVVSRDLHVLFVEANHVYMSKLHIEN